MKRGGAMRAGLTVGLAGTGLAAGLVADAIARRAARIARHDGLLRLRFGLRLGGLHRRFDLRQIRLVGHGYPP